MSSTFSCSWLGYTIMCALIKKSLKVEQVKAMLNLTLYRAVPKRICPECESLPPTPLLPPNILTGERGGETLGEDRRAEANLMSSNAITMAYMDISRKSAGYPTADQSLPTQWKFGMTQLRSRTLLPF